MRAAYLVLAILITPFAVNEQSEITDSEFK